MKSTIGNLMVSDIVGPKKHSLEGQPVEEMNIDNGLNHTKKKDEIVPFRHSGPDANPITPCKMEILRDKCCNYCKKRSEASCEVEHIKDGSTDGEYEHFLKMIRQLECEGHIEKSFRVKFLTCYSLRANSEDKRVVKVFVDTFTNDPSCLTGQLVDTFMEKISRKRPLPVRVKVMIWSIRTLMEGCDYVLAPQEVWKKLHYWYKGGPALPRGMIQQSSQIRSFSVEVYLLRLQLTDARDNNQFVIHISEKVHFDCIYRGIGALSSRESKLLAGNHSIALAIQLTYCS
ncbi:hypothetical protein GIB67_011278 [Kingdonia uniflora]|uniref:Uncharacterized protein n=1 Tax=Kingdonia uniflora TaxID=39325 RepID=A0A7J7MNT4_9MAGN|nr:hypothetical protein GIB67_011278 [Kingdonia uniflora]